MSPQAELLVAAAMFALEPRHYRERLRLAVKLVEGMELPEWPRSVLGAARDALEAGDEGLQDAAREAVWRALDHELSALVPPPRLTGAGRCPYCGGQNKRTARECVECEQTLVPWEE